VKLSVGFQNTKIHEGESKVHEVLGTGNRTRKKDDQITFPTSYHEHGSSVSSYLYTSNTV
jgi:hypothetical protein